MSTTITRFPAKFGKYILLDRLAAGGMAEVFIAKVMGVEGFERLVAIKCMLPALLNDTNFTQMFVDEARLAAQITHANVVQIYELGRQASRLYIAMELVQGHDLRHIIRTAKKQNTALPAPFVAYLIQRAASGLDYAHRASRADGQALGVVHRDVSPQNLLVSYNGEVKVVDFGIAKASSEVRVTETQVGVLKGKFGYMAPEQVVGEPLDRRADIFALGSVLYEALSGQRCFRGDNDLAVLEAVRDARVPDFAATLAPEAQRIIPILNQALALEPDRRFRTAGEMAKALDGMLIEGEHIFGPEQAAQWMQQAFGSEVVKQTEALKRYSQVTEESCVADLKNPGESTGRLVFESSFIDSPKAPVPAEHDAHEKTPSEPVAAYPARRTTPGRQVTLARRQPPAEIKSSTTPALLPAEAQDNISPATTQGASHVFAPLKPAPPDSKKRRRDDTDPDLHLERPGVRRSLRRLKLSLAVATVMLLGAGAYLMTRDQGVQLALQWRKDLSDWHPIARAQTLWRTVNVRELVDTWLFGGETLEHDEVPTYGYIQVVVSGVLHAQVFVDDDEMGWTPLTPLMLHIGEHRIRAEHRKASGIIESRQTQVTITGHERKNKPALIQLVF